MIGLGAFVLDHCTKVAQKAAHVNLARVTAADARRERTDVITFNEILDS